LFDACRHLADSGHEPTRALARELLNDGDTFWVVLDHPELPCALCLGGYLWLVGFAVYGIEHGRCLELGYILFCWQKTYAAAFTMAASIRCSFSKNDVFAPLPVAG